MPVTSTFSLEPEREANNYDGPVGNLQVMRRKQLWDLADAMGIKYAPGATKIEMITVIQGHQHVIKALDSAVDIVAQSGDKSKPLVDQVAEVFQKVKSPMDGVRVENQDDVLLRNMHISGLKKLCKERGIKFARTDTAAILRDRLGVENESSTDDNESEQSVSDTSGSDPLKSGGSDSSGTPA
jgi:hypothetical protein